MENNNMEITKDLIESIQIIDSIIYNESDSIDTETHLGIKVSIFEDKKTIWIPKTFIVSLPSKKWFDCKNRYMTVVQLNVSLTETFFNLFGGKFSRKYVFEWSDEIISLDWNDAIYYSLSQPRSNGWHLPDFEQLYLAYLDGIKFPISDKKNIYWSHWDYNGKGIAVNIETGEVIREEFSNINKVRLVKEYLDLSSNLNTNRHLILEKSAQLNTYFCKLQNMENFKFHHNSISLGVVKGKYYSIILMVLDMEEMTELGKRLKLESIINWFKNEVNYPIEYEILDSDKIEVKIDLYLKTKRSNYDMWFNGLYLKGLIHKYVNDTEYC